MTLKHRRWPWPSTLPRGPGSGQERQGRSREAGVQGVASTAAACRRDLGAQEGVTVGRRDPPPQGCWFQLQTGATPQLYRQREVGRRRADGKTLSCE